MCLQKRSLGRMILLFLVTFGFYFIYWAVTTKDEINCLGARIPTGILVIIPFVHFYFWFRYSEGFVKYVSRDSDPIAYFVLFAVLPIVGMFVVQDRINQIAD